MKNKTKLYKLKIKGYSLLYAILIMLIVSITSASLIYSSYFNFLYSTYVINKNKVINNVNSGLNLLISKDSDIGIDESVEIELYEEEENNLVKLTRNQWGFFEIISSQASYKDFVFQKTALTTEKIIDNDIALYLADLDKELSLCGKTIIKGRCFLPKSGVKRAYVERKTFIGDKLIDGKKEVSDKNLPTPKQKILDCNYENFLTKYLQESKYKILFFKEIENDSIITKFSDTTTIVYSKQPINLSNKIIIGNVIVISESNIIIDNNNTIEDAILSAPFIKIKRGFNGNMQCFASDSVSVEEDCLLKYPSAIGVINNSIAEYNSRININKNSIIEGIVLLYKKNIKKNNMPVLSIKQDATIKGQAYSNGIVEHEGNIYGSVYCLKFLLGTRSSVYENHILDAVIDVSKRSKFYAGINYNEENSRIVILKWLY